MRIFLSFSLSLWRPAMLTRYELPSLDGRIPTYLRSSCSPSTFISYIIIKNPLDSLIEKSMPRARRTHRHHEHVHIPAGKAICLSYASGRGETLQLGSSRWESNKCQGRYAQTSARYPSSHR
ncbi:hypothetical protein BOTBODRAFT_279666 [Botryobasidium botryosum FD-172 SS1]|uniref:Secreted protein n=1 Tax=Botryobasidium botryosum (strain FD-172 SS1) TaxID=930990 RepID=A0A067M248_BOTB1|nr:hypothetical protein BOTBODRAFT_279666 [Botryobasidium botryosum FD-172 SS1]